MNQLYFAGKYYVAYRDKDLAVYKIAEYIISDGKKVLNKFIYY